MRADAGAEHRIPPPERLFPERLRPRELAVLDHAFVTAPDVVHQNIDAASVVENAPEDSFYLIVQTVVAVDGRYTWADLAQILFRPACFVLVRSVQRQLVGDSFANVTTGAGHACYLVACGVPGDNVRSDG